jgi:WD40 repeat protein
VLAAATTNRVVKLWSTETGALLASFVVPGGPVSGLLWSTDGRALATADAAAGVFHFWDAATGAPSGRTGAHRKGVESVAWAAGRAALVTLDGDRRLRAWDAAGGRLLYERRLKGLKSLTFGPGGDAVLVFREYERPELLDPLTGEAKTLIGRRRFGALFGAWLSLFSPDGGRLLFRDGYGPLKLRDMRAGAEAEPRLARNKRDYFSGEFSRDGRTLALVRQSSTWSLRDANEVDLYDVESWATRATLKAKGFGRIYKVAWADDGATLAAAGESDPKLFPEGRLTAYTWRAADGAPYAAFPLEERDLGGFMTNARDADTVELLASGRVLLAYNREAVKFWDARTGERLFRRGADLVAVSPDLRLVAVATAGAARSQIWEAVAP